MKQKKLFDIKRTTISVCDGKPFVRVDSFNFRFCILNSIFRFEFLLYLYYWGEFSIVRCTSLLSVHLLFIWQSNAIFFRIIFSSRHMVFFLGLLKYTYKTLFQCVWIHKPKPFVKSSLIQTIFFLDMIWMLSELTLSQSELKMENSCRFYINNGLTINEIVRNYNFCCIIQCIFSRERNTSDTIFWLEIFHFHLWKFWALWK